MVTPRAVDAPAFPLSTEVATRRVLEKTDRQFSVDEGVGLTRLDYFTAKALQGMCSNPGVQGVYSAEQIAEESIALALAVLAALDGKSP